MDGGPADKGPTNPLVAARPYEYQVPSGYDPATPAPLLVLLHGYSASGLVQDLYFGMRPFADAQGILYAYPDGTPDSGGKRFWNATPACCDFEHRGIDDVAYLDAVIGDMSARYNVDRKRVYLAGHSNGGFMAYRLACERAARIAAIVSLAGAMDKDASRCQPSEPVAVLQVHGDQDGSVPYGGGPNEPSARESVADWAKRDGCSDRTDTSSPPLDLDKGIPGPETTAEKWTGCHPGGAAELWTIHGGTHIPNLQPTWAATIYGFLAAHPKP